MSLAMTKFPRTTNISIPRRFFYDLAIVFVLGISTHVSLIVWRAETKRIYREGKFLSQNIHEAERPLEFAAMKSGAWQRMSTFLTMTVLMIIFRREAHAFLGD